MSNEFLDFEDRDPKSGSKDKYEAVPGENDRIAIIWPRLTEEEQKAGVKKGPFSSAFTHYHTKNFVCKDSICCEKLGPAKQRFACLIVKYKTKEDGTPILKKPEACEAGELPFKFEVLKFIFTDAKFKKLKALHKEWDLKNRDFTVIPTGDKKFQNMDFQPLKECLWQLKPEYKEAVYKVSEEMRKNLNRSLGADLTIDEIKELLGMEVTALSDVSGPVDINELLEQV